MRVLQALLAVAVGATALPASAYEPGRGDFRHNQALYQHTIGNHLDAALELLTQSIGSTDHALFTTHELLNYGLYNAAEQRFLGLLAQNELSREERSELYLRLARYAFERGYDDAAAATLQAMEEDLGNYSFYERELLGAMVAGRQRRLEESITRLSDRRVAGRTNFGKYNLAMALFAAGDVRSARTKLDDIGREIANNPLEHALRDQANLTLAYDYLREANGSAALPVLQRIRVDGPFSEEALLALGWAELSAVAANRVRLREQDTQDTVGGVLGTILRPGKVDEDLRRRLGMLQSGENKNDGTLRYRRAISAWQTLAQRDVRRTAVLEVEVALPWALTQLGEYEAARRYYNVGLARLDVASKRLDSAIEATRNGRMFETLIRSRPNEYSGWNWRATELADADETWYLANTLGTTLFQEALKNYRDLRQLSRRLQADIRSLEDGPQSVLAAGDAAELIRRERQRYRDPLFPGLEPQLQIATELNRFPRNETLEGLLQWTYRFDPKRDLDLSRDLSVMPGSVSAEARPLLEEAQTLLADVEAAIPSQRKLLEEIALNTLLEQQEAIRKYQIEARFALARLYDQAPNDSEDRR